jgi:hypothetical protein
MVDLAALLERPDRKAFPKGLVYTCRTCTCAYGAMFSLSTAVSVSKRPSIVGTGIVMGQSWKPRSWRVKDGTCCWSSQA